MARRCVTRLALVAALALLGMPAGAAADGDPASDVLLTTDSFYPYKQVSRKLVEALDKTVARSRAAGFPIKVALIAERTDLGTVPGMLGHPQQYSQFLHPEISFNSNPRLLVVMAKGFGLVNAGPASAIASLTPDSGGGSDALARAAIRAVELLARKAGHPFAPVAVPAGGGSGGTPVLLVFGGPVALVALVAGVALLMRSRRDEAEDEDGAAVS
jgi:hypothetical protein